MLILRQDFHRHIPNHNSNRIVNSNSSSNHILHTLDCCINHSFNCCSHSFGHIVADLNLSGHIRRHLGFVGSFVDRLTFY